jgi:hypothetical protein
VRDRQGEGAADASIGQELVALKRMFNLAIRARELTEKPDFRDLRRALAHRRTCIAGGQRWVTV